MKIFTVVFLFSFSEILEEMLVKRCCLGCNKLKTSTTSYKGHNRQIIQQFNISTRSHILLPVYGKSIATFKLPYQPLLNLKHVDIIGKKIEVSAESYTSHLIISAFSTWPLLLIALLMAICAGSLIWLFVRIIIWFFPWKRACKLKIKQIKSNFVFRILGEIKVNSQDDSQMVHTKDSGGLLFLWQQ